MIAAACSRVFHRARLHDPLLARLRGATRSALACSLTASLGLAWAVRHHVPLTAAIPAALFAMIAPLFLREARWSGWLVTLALLASCAGLSLAAGAAVADQPLWRGAGSLLVVFAGVLGQSLGARAVGAAMLTLVSFYLGLYLHPDPTRLMQMLGLMTFAPAVLALVGRALIPVEHGLPPGERPARAPLAAMLAHRLHHLAWRPALTATAAALLAMLAGGALSEDRAMWAVISTFVVFLGTTSHQGTRTRVVQRVIGTLAGAAASVLLVTVFAHQTGVLVAAMIASVFGWAYYILHAYARGVFFITLLVGLLYGTLGFAIVPLAAMRIEEVLAGCLISLALALLLMPSEAAHAAGTQRNAPAAERNPVRN
ncbi:FUSC family protein [Burkholderia sp. 22PA0106]|uniref:FUSC family protein n=1 Tax=Burkholderia sp. 22PA0106 TaxID=3237371 RepID=UPI0039C3AED9